MKLALYDASVANYMRVLRAVEGFLARSATQFEKLGLARAEILTGRIHPDAHPFRSHVTSVVQHSADAGEALLSGVFAPQPDERPHDYESLQDLVAEGRKRLAALSIDEVNARAGVEVTIHSGSSEMHFAAESFALAFSTPNLHFHAVTAYDILLQKGVKLGKLDYMGRPTRPGR